MECLKIVNYEDKYHDSFIALSREWLEKYASVEPEDEKMLSNPRGEILDIGGYIFFALLDNEPVGTVALIPESTGAFELAKLAVTDKHQNKKIGRILMDACISKAKDEKASHIILYTSYRLGAAVALYRKYGFVEVPLEDNKYIESDMKMLLKL